MRAPLASIAPSRPHCCGVVCGDGGTCSLAAHPLPNPCQCPDVTCVPSPGPSPSSFPTGKLVSRVGCPSIRPSKRSSRVSPNTSPSTQTPWCCLCVVRSEVSGQWVHGSCAMWAPSLGLAANKTVTGTRALLEGRAKPCSVCKKEVGTRCMQVYMVGGGVCSCYTPNMPYGHPHPVGVAPPLNGASSV